MHMVQGAGEGSLYSRGEVAFSWKNATWLRGFRKEQNRNHFRWRAASTGFHFVVGRDGRDGQRVESLAESSQWPDSGG